MKFAPCAVLMYYIGIRQCMRRYIMQEVIKFFKEIFLMKPEDKRIGLCQFKAVEPVEKPVKKVIKPASEIKLSDLMRRSY